MPTMRHARKLADLAVKTSAVLTVTGYAEYQNRNPHGSVLATLISARTVTGIDAQGYALLEQAITSAQELVAREAAARQLEANELEDPLMAFLATLPSPAPAGASWFLQYQDVSEWKAAGAMRHTPYLAAARVLPMLSAAGVSPEAQRMAVECLMETGGYVAPDGRTWRIVQG